MTRDKVLNAYNWIGRLIAAENGFCLEDLINDENKQVREEAKRQMRLRSDQNKGD